MKKKNKGALAFVAVCMLFLSFRFIFLSGNTSDVSYEQEYGSFSPEDVESFDGKFTAFQKVEKFNDMKYVRVYVYDNESGALADRFFVARAWDFWGICWEEDSYNIWIQSADIGIYCYRYEDGTWSRDDDAARPESIVSRWEAKEAAKE